MKKTSPLALLMFCALIGPLWGAEGTRLHELPAISAPYNTNTWIILSDKETTNTYRMPLNLVGTWLGLTKATDWDTSAEIIANLQGDKSGSGKLVFNVLPELISPYINGWGNAQHPHTSWAGGGLLDASAIGYGTIDPARLPAGALSADYADRTLVVDGTNGNDVTAVRGRQDLAYKTILAAVTNLQSGDLLVIRPGTYTVARPGMPPNSGDYGNHAYANFVLKNLTNVTILGHGAVVASTGLGNVWSIVDCDRVTVLGLTMRGPGMNPVISSQICGEISLWGTNRNLTFSQMRFQDFPNHGILVSQLEKTSYQTLVDGCVFLRGGTTNHTALTVDGAAVASLGPGLRVVNCTFDQVTRGVEIEGSGTLPKGPVVIADFTMTNIYNQGIILMETSGVGGNLNDIQIGPGVISLDKQAWTGQGQYGITASGGRNISVANVTVTGANNSGFSFGTGHADLRRSGFRGCTAVSCGVSFAITDANNRGIFDNYIEHCQAIASTTAQGGIVVAGNATTVRGNTVADSAGYGIFVIPNGAGSGGTVNVTVADNLIRTPGFHAIGVAAGSVDTVVSGNNLRYAVNKISDGGTGTRVDTFETMTVLGHVAAGTLGTTDNPDIDDVLDGKMASDKTFAVGEITGWGALPAFGVGYVPTFDVATVTNTFDLSWAGKPVVDVIVSTALTITDSDRLTATNKTKFPVLRLRSTQATNCALILPEDWDSASGVYPLEVKAGETLRIYPEWSFGRVEFSWTGDQSRPMGVGPGGTGNSRGVATAPIWTRYTPTVVNVTNWPVELLSGTRVIENFNTNLNIYAVSGAPTDPTEVLGQVWTLRNTNTTMANSNKITWAAGINAVGFDTNYLWVPTNGYARLEFEVSSDVTNLINRFATTTTLGGGTGTTTPSTITNGLIAYWEGQDATDAAMADSHDSYDLTPSSVTHFTVGETGAINDAWGASSDEGYLSRVNTSLIASSSGARSYVAWVKFTSLNDFDTVFGIHGSSPNYSWRCYVSSSEFRVHYSLNGTATSFYSTGDAAVTGNWYMVYVLVDNANDLIGWSLNGESASTQATGGNLYASASAFTLCNRSDSIYDGIQGLIQYSGVWDRALTDVELSWLYNSGTPRTYAELDDAL